MQSFIRIILLFVSLFLSCYSDSEGKNKYQSENSKSQDDASSLVIKEIRAGEGKSAQDGDVVTTHYTGVLVNGKKFDSSRDRHQPFTFTLGRGEVIKGWERGIKGMKVGCIRKLIIPAYLAYGDRGAGDIIPPNSTLIFEVELLKIE